MLFLAIGQRGAPEALDGAPIEVKDGRIVVDAERRTTLAGRLGRRRLRLRRPGPDGERRRGRQAGGALDRGRARRDRAPDLSEDPMADLRTNFLGVKSPNPFWLASAPPTDRKVNVERAFRAGWGGVVWKTLGEAGPPVVNVSGARYGAIHGPDRRLIAMNNIELITDRDLEINLQEIKEVKRAWPDRALIVSLMVPCDEKSWENILARVEETECDGVELNFGCPHGMSRARHGLGRRPGARICRDGRALVQGAHPHAGHREADAQHHRHPPARRARRRTAAPTRCRSSTPSIRSWTSISTT